jgi:hypothetical protein
MTVMDFDLFETSTPVPSAPATAPQASNVAGFSMKQAEEWDWEDLRNYVVHEIERYHGPQPRDAMKEKAIFGSFIKRHGSSASAAIAQFAFGFCEGMWSNAPITVNRFCKASDPFFADPIKQRLA